MTTEIMEKPIRDAIRYLVQYKDCIRYLVQYKDCIMMVVMMTTKMIYTKQRKTLRMQTFSTSDICTAN